MEQETGGLGHTYIGAFDDVQAAQMVINDLRQAGFTPDSISVVAHNSQDQESIDTGTGSNAAVGDAITGSLAGGTVGAVLGWLTAAGISLIPGVGPIVAAGLFFGTTVGGALAGGTLGGIAGGLIGSGIPDAEAQEYEEHVKAGRNLVAVSIKNAADLETAKALFAKASARSARNYNLKNQGSPSQDEPLPQVGEEPAVNPLYVTGENGSDLQAGNEPGFYREGQQERTAPQREGEVDSPGPQTLYSQPPLRRPFSGPSVETRSGATSFSGDEALSSEFDPNRPEHQRGPGIRGDLETPG